MCFNLLKFFLHVIVELSSRDLLAGTLYAESEAFLPSTLPRRRLNGHWYLENSEGDSGHLG